MAIASFGARPDPLPASITTLTVANVD
jgi:hypothetical protein